MVSTFIIDDEPRSVATLSNMIRDYFPPLEVTGIAHSLEEGLELLQNNTPDLLFLDIAMPDGSGFELLEKLEDKPFDVIFTTAFEQYAIKAFDFSALNYLLKPIDLEYMQKVINQYLTKGSHASYNARFSILERALKKDFQKIALPCIDGIEFVALDEIVYCQADSSYCVFHFANGTKSVISRSLATYEKLLSEVHFFRIHHKYLLNMKYVKKYVKGSGGYVILKDNTHLDVSVRRKEAFLEKIAQLTGY